MAQIRAALEQAFAQCTIEIDDESHLHRGHAGAQTGKGHYKLRLTAASFQGHTSIARHRMIYAALGELMNTDIHALTISARSPDEVAAAES